MADLNELQDLVQQALDAAELGVVLEIDAESIARWRARLDLPGPVDVEVERSGADAHLSVGPLHVDVAGKDVVARLDTPGPDLQVEYTGGELRGPRLVRDGGNLPLPREQLLERRFRSIRRRVRLGHHDEDLEVLVEEEQAGRNRNRVLRCLRRRIERVND